MDKLTEVCCEDTVAEHDLTMPVCTVLYLNEILQELDRLLCLVPLDNDILELPVKI